MYFIPVIVFELLFELFIFCSNVFNCFAYPLLWCISFGLCLDAFGACVNCLVAEMCYINKLALPHNKSIQLVISFSSLCSALSINLKMKSLFHIRFYNHYGSNVLWLWKLFASGIFVKKCILLYIMCTQMENNISVWLNDFILLLASLDFHKTYHIDYKLANHRMTSTFTAQL